MTNPYHIEGPALISFSGGRTSGFMLYQILQAYDGTLPADVYVTFANTGKEMPETLDFVRDCGEHWDVAIHWLELRVYEERPIYRTEEVTYEIASRKGEPFEALIERKKMLPNPMTRLCTSELKINVMKRFMQEKGYKEWVNVIGLRYDEPRRVASQRRINDSGKNKWESLSPLNSDKVSVETVGKFWANNDFDLKLANHNGKTLAGNCDLCFLKGTQTLINIIRERPDLADWWLEQEEKVTRLQIESKGVSGSTDRFRLDRDYIKLVDLAELEAKQTDFFDDDSRSCFCHD
jgi:3'-phosphoadenosine 5'-phosphosulfate sulfotransferase (PAPS reductase)/FAD synthetase